jgi:Fe2+ transport system protein FeoA
MKKLSELPVGTFVVLESFNPNLNPDFQKDLMDHGFLPGTKLKIYEKYFSAQKLLVQVGETKLALRISDAENIYCKEII